ncbi:MAG: ABC transporter ATP-binding protein, partial [Chloroflexi bacterium]|nr:ABC transporter ATP-binding protein [Chloroflexota bacterium]
MMGGPAGRHGGFLNQETLKPKSTSETLGRLVKHFAPFWPALLAAVVFVVIATWAQVTNPELTGELVDCYLSPTSASSGF